jgi:hypothetical protein
MARPGPADEVAATVFARAGVRVRMVDRKQFREQPALWRQLSPGTFPVLRRLIPSNRRERSGPAICWKAVDRVERWASRPLPWAVQSRNRQHDLDCWLLEET